LDYDEVKLTATQMLHISNAGWLYPNLSTARNRLSFVGWLSAAANGYQQFQILLSRLPVEQQDLIFNQLTLQQVLELFYFTDRERGRLLKFLKKSGESTLPGATLSRVRYVAYNEWRHQVKEFVKKENRGPDWRGRRGEAVTQRAAAIAKGRGLHPNALKNKLTQRQKYDVRM
jgi:hypothetical protein